jgi:hypothetical protein
MTSAPESARLPIARQFRIGRTFVRRILVPKNSPSGRYAALPKGHRVYHHGYQSVLRSRITGMNHRRSLEQLSPCLIVDRL